MKKNGCHSVVVNGKWYFYCYRLRGKPCDYYAPDYRDYRHCCRESDGEHNEYCRSYSAQRESQAVEVMERL